MSNRGFIVLPVVIVIAALLTAALTAASAAGSRASARALGVETRTQAQTLADACAELAIARLGVDASYVGDESVRFPDGECAILPPQPVVSGAVRFQTQAVVNGYVATTSFVFYDDGRCTPVSSLTRGPP